MTEKPFDFGETHERLDPTVRARIKPFLCGRWNQDNVAVFYHAALSVGNVEMALNHCMLESSDLSDRELEFITRIFKMAMAVSMADLRSKVESGKLDSKGFDSLCKFVYEKAVAAVKPAKGGGGGDLNVYVDGGGDGDGGKGTTE